MDGERSAVADPITLDKLLRGRVTLLQPARGFRSSLDPLLLSAFIRPPFGRFVDIGCGTGALAFSLAAIDPAATGVGVELQPRLAALATRGLAQNDFASRLEIIEADVRAVVGRPPTGRAAFDLVATNPPFRKLAGGVLSPDGERARAYHEVTLTLREWLEAAAGLVKPGGRVAAIFDAARVDELLDELRARSLGVRRLRLVHARLAQPPSRVLVEAAPVAPGMSASPAVVEAPLELRGPAGHSDEVRKILGDD